LEPRRERKLVTVEGEDRDHDVVANPGDADRETGEPQQLSPCKWVEASKIIGRPDFWNHDDPMRLPTFALLLAGLLLSVAHAADIQHLPGKVVRVVRLDGEDVNLHMVDRGPAWHYKRYEAEQTPERREMYSAAERAAQGARRGLWSGPEPVAPWEWRKR
jgi:hypothetical protein